MPRLRNADACHDAASRGLQWLQERCGTTEEWTAFPHPLLVYHKVPCLMALLGLQEHCRRALLWIREKLMLPDGDLLAAPAAGGETPVRARTFEKAWIAIAAQMTGRFDVSFDIARFLAAHQGGSTGAVYDLDPHGESEPSAHVPVTATAGQLFLYCGMREEARLAGRFLARVLEMQPEEDRFYVRIHDDGKLVTKLPRDKAGKDVVTASQKKAAISAVAVPAVFFCQLHVATGEPAWREAALDYYTFAEACAPDPAVLEDGASLAWAAAWLYNITRRRVYYDAAERITQGWIDQQKPDGRWTPLGKSRDDGEVIALTARTALYLAETAREAQ
jgi:hypothetical protein